MYKTIRIGGVTFLFSPLAHIETASLGIFLKTGARFEPAQQKGIAHFVEHLLFKGSASCSYKKIKREIEGRGGALNGFTSQEMTAYYAHFLKKNLKSTLPILLDMVFFPLFKEKDIRKERNVILEEIKMYNDLPSSRVITVLDELLWRNHPLGTDVIGDEASVARIRRSDLIRFHRKFYRNSNVVVSCSGNFSEEQLMKMLVSKLPSLRRARMPRAYPPRRLGSLRVSVESRPLEQTYLCIGFRAVPWDHPARPALEILNVLLGANMSSRLFEEVREKKGLCYDVSTEVRKYRDSGGFVIHLGLDKRNLLAAFRTILKELKKISRIPVPSSELARAKDFYLGQVAMGLEQPQGRMFYQAKSHISLGKVDSFDVLRHTIEKVSPGEIRRMAGRVFDLKKAAVSCVGNVPQSIEERLRKVIRKGGSYR
ncbi:MAG: hypothetical protein GF333_02225 [Candidatus Omnitrophica bacterium]|nr:hypothetical protein [Candidatus Omnitrophota bacterium]